MKTWGPAGPIFFLKVEHCTEVSEGDVNFLHIRSAGLPLCCTCVSDCYYQRTWDLALTGFLFSAACLFSCTGKSGVLAFYEFIH